MTTAIHSSVADVGSSAVGNVTDATHATHATHAAHATDATHASSRPLAVRVRGLTRRFGDRAVIDALNLDIATGEFVALIGRSGCGKSTLLRVLADLDQEAEGDVVVPQQRAVAFQAPRLMPWLRVWRNVALGRAGRPDAERAAAALREVGLDHRRDVWPRVLSGGEAQRAALARALIREPDLLLLDEPFGALDALTRANAQQLVARLWHAHGCAVMLITHDVDEALLLADRVLVMQDGRIAHAVAVDLPRGRDATSPRFGELRRELLAHLGVVSDEEDLPIAVEAVAA